MMGMRVPALGYDGPYLVRWGAHPTARNLKEFEVLKRFVAADLKRISGRHHLFNEPVAQDTHQ
jgi:hypothetical protein